MLQKIDLRELAQHQGNGLDFVSAYFSAADGLESLKGRQRTLRAMIDDDSIEAENFDRSIEMMHEALESHSTDDAESVCIFASAILDFVRGYPLAVPTPTEMHVGAAPYLRPLAELQDEYETFALISCDNDRTEIALVSEERAVEEASIKGGIKNRVRKGGWSQQRYSRRRDAQLTHYAKEVVDALQDIQDKQSFERIVLVGSEETMREIVEEMPEQLASLVASQEPFDLDRSEQEMIEKAADAAEEDERQQDETLWQKIKNEYMRHGLAAAGATDVLEAALIGRVEEMMVTRDVEIAGTRCRECEHIVHGTPDTCQQCGAKDVFEVDLVDALARQMELTSAEVHFVDPIQGLSKIGDVAALLRY